MHAPVGKTVLRQQLGERLAALDPDEARVAAGRVHERLLARPEVARARRIFACLSFGHEIDTWALVERLLASGRTVYVPRADPRDGQLHLHEYPCELRTLSFGLRQPPRRLPELNREAIDGTIDVALVLGLGFDRRGYRLGYGSGYFDRFLARRPFPAVGLAYDAQLIERLPEEPHDVPMRVVVTDKGSWPE
jgi:5-formyltetrahydrofolate cyclo-ligase